MNASNGNSHHPDSGQSALGLAPGQFVPVALPEAPDRDPEPAFQLKPYQVWSAFRRRWFLAVTLGLIAAVPVAYLAWEKVPAPYVAEAEIQILSARPRVQFDLQEDRINFNTFKSTQMKEVLHPETLNMALSLNGISQLPPLSELKGSIDPIDWLRKNVVISGRQQEFFTISLEGEYPESLQKIVKSIQEAYFKRNVLSTNLSAGKRQEHLKKQQDLLDTDIAAKQARLAELAKQANAANASQRDLQRESTLALIGELQKDIIAIDREVIGLESQLKYLDSVQGERTDGSGEILGEKELQALVELDERYQKANLNTKRIERSVERYREVFNNEDHPTLKTLRASLEQSRQAQESLKTQLQEFYLTEVRKQRELQSEQSRLSLVDNIANLKQLRKDLQSNLDAQKVKDVELGSTGLEMASVEEELTEKKDLARKIREELNKIEIEKDAGERIKLSYAAKVPTQRVMKRKYMMAGGGGVACFGLIVALVTLLEMRYMKIDSLKHLEDEFQFPILGIIPNLPARLTSRPDASGKSAFYMHAFTESIDTTRTMLLNQQKKAPLKVIMVTSALGGEGKSTLSCHLAISFARAGRKTLLIDGDLRSPRVHEVFGITDFPGLCEVLRDETPVEKCVHATPISGLELLPAGELDADTLRLLAEERLNKVLTELRGKYDVIILDSAPILPVNDSLLILQSVDGVVLSIRKDVSRVAKVTAALSKIEMLGGKLLGGVVTGIDEADYGYRSKYIRNYQNSFSRREERELAAAER